MTQPIRYAKCVTLLFLSLVMFRCGVTNLHAQTANPFVHQLFANHMVLQRDVSDPVWGWVAPGTTVTVNVYDQNNALIQTKTAVADASGRWQVAVGPFGLVPNNTAYSMTISAPGQTTVTLTDVLIGDVLLCSGQSNMPFPVNQAYNSAAEIADSINYPNIRHFTVPVVPASTPQSTLTSGSWVAASPSTTGAFTAVGYFTAREIYKKQGMPIGIILSALGSTLIQQWSSSNVIASVSDFTQTVYDQAAQPLTTGTLSSLYNGMIYPLSPFRVGAIEWYQGESNSGQPEQYGRLLPSLMDNWRTLFGQPNLPFLIVQISGFVNQPSSWANTRWWQAKTVANDTNSRLVVTLDVGYDNIHPPDKQDMGQRAAWASANFIYGNNIVDQSPVLNGFTVSGTNVICTFTNVGAGLMVGSKSYTNPIVPVQQVIGGTLGGFLVAGTNQTFYAAKAFITNGNQVVLSSPSVTQPAAVEYAWDSAPTNSNLYNSITNGIGTVVDGLPTGSFSTVSDNMLNVNYGTGTGNYQLGDRVSITASNVTGLVFDHWSGDTNFLDSTTSATTMATVGQSYVSVLANYRINGSPTGMNVIMQYGKISIDWKPIPTVHYNIKRSTSVAGPFTALATNLYPTSFSDSNVTAGTTYYYVVSAVNPLGEGTNSTPVSITYNNSALSEASWTASASVSFSGQPPANAIDGDITTRWTSGTGQTNGMWFQVDMGGNRSFTNLLIYAGNGTGDYPRSYQVNVSTDGVNWGSPVASGTGITSLTSITFPMQTARYIRITDTGNTTSWWSIWELEVYGISLSGYMTWDANGTHVPSPSDGSGNWLTASNWWDGAENVNGTWSGSTPDSALFGAGTAGNYTINLGDGTVTASSVTFATSGYTLTNGTLSFVGSGPHIVVNAGVTDTANCTANAASLSVGTGGVLNLGGGASGFLSGGATGAGTINFNSPSAKTFTTGGNQAWNVGDPVGLTGGLVVSNNSTFSEAGSFIVGGSGSTGLVTINSPTAVYNITGTGATLLGRYSNANTKGRLQLINGLLNAADSTGVRVGYQLGSGSATSEFDIIGGTYIQNNPLLILENSTLATATVNISGGTTMLGGINFGNNSTSGTANFTMSGGTMYLSSGGITNLSTGSFTPTITLSGGKIGANAGWTSLMPMTLSGNIIFQTADTNNNPQNITLGGILSGFGGLTKTGGGTLTLNGANTYNGGTTINAGTLALTTMNSSMPYTNNGATMNIKLATVGGTLPASSVVFGGSSPQITFDLANLGVATSPVFSCGSLVINADVTINAVNAATNGASVLLTYSGTRTGAGNFVAGTIPSGGAIVDDTTNKQVILYYPSSGQQPTPPPTIGATVPFTSYQAENGMVGGGAMVVTATFPPVDQYSTPALEASQRGYVQLTNTGQYVEWTNNTGTNITAINLRSCIPDAPTGGGIDSTIDLYVDGIFCQAVPVSSHNTWIYEGTNYGIETDDNPADGKPYHFWDDSHALLNTPIPPGHTFRLQMDSSNTAAFYYIDVVDVEAPPAPLAQPPNSLSVLSYGVVSNNPSVDNTAAFNSCFSAAASQGKIAWIPPGIFYMSATNRGLTAIKVTIQGAGPWYTTIYRYAPPANNASLAASIFSGFDSSTLRDVCLDTGSTMFKNTQNAGAFGNITGTNWLVDDVWIQHVTTAFWACGVGGTARNCRVLSVWADGGNFNNLAGALIGVNLTYSNNYVRGTGDDGMAINSVAYNTASGGVTNYFNLMTNISYVNNTAGCVWRGHCMGIYGGYNDYVANNLLYDNARSRGLAVSTFGVNGSGLASGTVVSNVIVRCGGNLLNQQQEAVSMGNTPPALQVANVYFANNIVSNSVYDSINISGCTNFVLQRNTIINPGRNGIVVSANNVRSSIILNSNTVSGLLAGKVALTNNSASAVMIVPTMGSAYNSAPGLVTEPCSEGGLDVSNIVNGSYAVYNNVNFTNLNCFVARTASGGSGGSIQIRLDSASGTLLGTCNIGATGGWQIWTNTYCGISRTNGTHNIYLVFTGGGGQLFNLEFFALFSQLPGLSHQLLVGSTYSLNALVNGKYVSAPNGGASALIANASSVTSSEEYKIYDKGNGQIALQSLVNNKYVSAASGGANPLIASATSPATFETFLEVDAGNGNIGLQAIVNGKYVTAPNGGTSSLIARSTNVGINESFAVGVVSSVPPGAPLSVTAISDNGQVTLSWNASPGAASYNVKVSTTSGGPYTLITNVTSLSFTNTGLVNGTTYYYVVSALNGAGEGANSAQVSATVGALLPNEWVASASLNTYTAYLAIDGNTNSRWTTGTSQVNGQWFQVDMGQTNTIFTVILNTGTSTGDYPRGYAVYVSGDGINWGSPVATGGVGSAVTTINVATNTTGRFLRVYQTGSTSGWWSIAEFGLNGASGTIATTPTGLMAAATTNQIILTWNPSSRALSYNVKRSLTNGGPYSLIGTATIPAYTISNALVGQTYYYVVSAVDVAGESANSSSAAAAAVPDNVAIAINGTLNTIGLNIFATQGQTCVLEACDALGQPWFPVATNTAQVTGAMTLSDGISATNQTRFYRIRFQ